MNKVIMIGRICKDIELRHSQGGMAYCSFTLAVNRRKKQGEEQQADFISCKAFGKTSEFLAKYMSKGRQIAVEGRLQTGSYDKDGTKVYTTDVICDNCYFADSAKATTENVEPNNDMLLEGINALAF
jgi:single-strand DNA-binding protein